jgi:hypothetical protein
MRCVGMLVGYAFKPFNQLIDILYFPVGGFFGFAVFF